MKITATLLLARLMLAWIFIPSGAFKLIDANTAAAYISNTAGLPFPNLLAPATGLFEVLFGLAIILGFRVRVAGLCLAAFCVATAFLFHAGKGYVPGLSEQAIELLSELHLYMVFKNISMAGGLIVLAVYGAGNWSIDHWLNRRKGI